METRVGKDAEAKVWAMIKDIKVAMMATHADGEHFHARPMVATQREFAEGTLWFFTDKRSRKVDELESNDRVLLAYADWDSQNYVSVDGRARIVEDRQKIAELWSEGMRIWFPQGKDDPNIALLAVTVDSAEYWDSPSSTMVHAYGYLKAVTTGQRPNPGESARVLF
jgi:general stress protein 26